MKLQHLSLLIITILFSITSCKSDDDGERLLPQEQQNTLDDRAIVKFLEDHYFDSVGKVKKFSEDITTDDNETPLKDIAVMDPSGYWYVKRPDVQATGRTISTPENDSILLQFDLTSFVANEVDDVAHYSSLRNVSTTINTTGYPIWDPSFYYKDVSGIDDARKSWYEMEGIQEGLKHFNAKDKAIDALPAVDFQGLIIIPSRLAFERDYNTLNISPDTSFYLNFELYQVVDRE